MLGDAALTGGLQLLGLIIFPTLLFRSTATLSLAGIDGRLVCAVIASKFAVYGVAWSVGKLSADKASSETEMERLRPAVMVLFCTMSDDIGIGYGIRCDSNATQTRSR